METPILVDVRQVAIAFMVMSDQPKKTLDLAAVHGLTEGGYVSGNLFRHARKLKNSQQFKHIAVVGGNGDGFGDNKNAWIGAERAIGGLVSVGFSANEILLTDPIHHSKEEAVHILKLAREKQFRSVGSISIAYHGGRMLPYMVAAMQEANYWVDYHMLPPPRTDWWLAFLGNQGQKITTCFEAAIDDAIKIEAHIAKGFAASFEDTIYYLQHREEIVHNQTWG